MAWGDDCVTKCYPSSYLVIAKVALTCPNYGEYQSTRNVHWQGPGCSDFGWKGNWRSGIGHHRQWCEWWLGESNALRSKLLTECGLGVPRQPSALLILPASNGLPIIITGHVAACCIAKGDCCPVSMNLGECHVPDQRVSRCTGCLLGGLALDWTGPQC